MPNFICYHWLLFIMKGLVGIVFGLWFAASSCGNSQIYSQNVDKNEDRYRVHGCARLDVGHGSTTNQIGESMEPSFTEQDLAETHVRDMAWNLVKDEYKRNTLQIRPISYQKDDGSTCYAMDLPNAWVNSTGTDS